MYDQYYNFTGRPFQLTPDPQFYFESTTHRKAMSYLGYGLAQGEGFIIITGDIGAGKTTLVGHLMATIDPQRLTAVKIVSTHVSGDDMLRLAAQSFGIPTDDVEKAHILSRIEAFLHHQARAGRRTLLIVDEAQNLGGDALEELRMLSNFQLGGQALLQIFLLGQPEFRDKIAGTERLEQIRQRVIATHHLEPMRASEVAPYIEHRLKVVGWKGNPRFTPDAYSILARSSGGVPRRLNALVSRVLLLGAIDHLDIIDERVVEAVVADLEGDLPDEGDEAFDLVETRASAPPPDDFHDFADDGQGATIANMPLPEPAPVVSFSSPTPEPAVGASPAAMFRPAPASVPVQAPAGSEGDVGGLRALRDEVQALNAAIGRGDDEPGESAIATTAVEGRLARIEVRLDEQEEVLRGVLARLIEWVERDGSRGTLPNRAA